MKRLARLRFRHLEAFLEVARLTSVGRAAESLNLSQPAVSRTLRELEAICGRPLIARDGRGIRLTAHGEVFLRHAGGTLAAARNGLAALSEMGPAEGPPIRVGALPTVSASLMPRAVALYLATGTANRLVISSGENRVLLDQLRGGELEMVMGRLPAPETMQGLMFEPLYRDRVAFVVRRGHPLAGARRVSSEDLARWPVLMPPHGSIIRPLYDRLAVEQGLAEPPVRIETVSDSFGRAFVREHDAIWIITRGVVRSEIEQGEFAELPIDAAATAGSVGLTLRAEAELPAAAQVLADILRRVAAETA